MAFFNEAYLNHVRSYVSESIVSAKYKIGETLYNATIKSNVVSGDNIVVILECSGIPDGVQTISEVFLYDSNGDVVASKVEEVTKTLNQGVLFKFKLPIKEV